MCELLGAYISYDSLLTLDRYDRDLFFKIQHFSKLVQDLLQLHELYLKVPHPILGR